MAVILSYAFVASPTYRKAPAARSARYTLAAASASLAIEIPASARTALEQASAFSPPSTPPLLSASSSSFSDGITLLEDDISFAICEKEKTRRKSQEFFFPRQTSFESAVPSVTRARDVVLKDHPTVDGAYAEYERLYNADSLVTKDGRHMVRLL
ncbi:hypothetical protein BGZ95_011759 [Linnemannia exigua]|uniref:Uncharacterized protein n=1 Tax=Linnemannia exigua TaxID=604196 RepID=A0AAD4H5E4_9FUNG|nr:hypothetical protein BGZ95_011759 [Linnemannia exigua]